MSTSWYPINPLSNSQQNTQYYGNQYNPPVVDKSKVAKEASVSLARLIEQQLGYDTGHVDPVALRLFIRAYWSRVAAYAHSIHDE